MLKRIRNEFHKLLNEKAPQRPEPVLMSAGYCPACAKDTTFVATEPWLRDHFKCSSCGSIPRERALMAVVDAWAPHWRNLTIHEASPFYERGASKRIRDECPTYIPSQLYDAVRPGKYVAVPDYSKRRKNALKSMRCEDLEAMSFADSSIDLHITQDVLEHVFNPPQVFREIARTLKPGGMHIFTVPLGRKQLPSTLRAQLGADGALVHLQPPVFHNDMVADEGALVVMDWGYDICAHIFEACGLFTHLIHIDDLSRGIRADLIEVLVTVKPASGDSSRIA